MPCRTRLRPAAPSSVSSGWDSTQPSWWPTALTSTARRQSPTHQVTSGLQTGESRRRWLQERRERVYSKSHTVLLSFADLQLRGVRDCRGQRRPAGNQDSAAPQRRLQGVLVRGQSERCGVASVSAASTRAKTASAFSACVVSCRGRHKVQQLCQLPHLFERTEAQHFAGEMCPFFLRQIDE